MYTLKRKIAIFGHFGTVFGNFFSRPSMGAAWLFCEDFIDQIPRSITWEIFQKMQKCAGSVFREPGRPALSVPAESPWVVSAPDGMRGPDAILTWIQ